MSPTNVPHAVRYLGVDASGAQLSNLRVERKTFWGVFGKCFGLNLSV